MCRVHDARGCFLKIFHSCCSFVRSRRECATDRVVRWTFGARVSRHRARRSVGGGRRDGSSRFDSIRFDSIVI